MTVKTTKLGGTDWSDGDTLTAADLNNTFEALGVFEAQDQTGGATASTSHAKIGEVTIAANKVNAGVLVIASGMYEGPTSGSETGSIKLWGGTSSTPSLNTQFKEITMSETVPDGERTPNGWTIAYYVTGLTWSSANYIQITGASPSGNGAVTCWSIVTIAF